MDNIQEMVELGKQSFENKDYGRAERYLRQVLNDNRRYADVHNMLGVICHIDGKFESAISCFKEALKINPYYTEALLNLAVLYNDLGRYPEAKKLYINLRTKKEDGTKQEIEPVLKGKLSNMHAEVGDVYRSIGLYKFAVAEYKKALELNPSYVDIRTKMGVALREDGQLENSLKELKVVSKDDPRYVMSRIQLGVTYYSLAKLKDAKKEWESVLKQDPENESAKMYLRLCEKPKG
ncbi:MAG: tetratricopeptide repeat protein [Deltaproteobacteria bacterium]|nr:tetratricopeptide repeat protein [Deltaproteobacteria bacterium]